MIFASLWTNLKTLGLRRRLREEITPDPHPTENIPAPQSLWIIFFVVTLAVSAVTAWVAYDTLLLTSESETVSNDDAAAEQSIITSKLSFSTLPELTSGHYVLWMADGGSPVAVASFRVDDNGGLTDLDGRVFDDNIVTFSWGSRLPTRAVISIESDDSSDPVVPTTELMAGSFSSKSAQLRFQSTDLTEASGTFVLATPTDEVSENERAGIWFFTPGDSLRSSLVLPDAPKGWVYESWIVLDDRTLSLGRFSVVAGKDSFSGYSGDKAGPAFPGEDLLRNAPDGIVFPAALADVRARVAVTLEPDNAGVDPTGDGQFILNILESTVTETLEPRTPSALVSSDFSPPTGVVTIR